MNNIIVFPRVKENAHKIVQGKTCSAKIIVFPVKEKRLSFNEKILMFRG